VGRRAGHGQCELAYTSVPGRRFEPGSAAGRAYAERCGGASEHAALIARLQALLTEDPSAASLTATCAICGCSVVVTR